jgi:NADH/F420H2 dehydrogenase subunit C
MTDQDTPMEAPDDAPEARSLPESELLAGLVEPFADATWELSTGQDVVRLPKEQLREFVAAAKDAGFEMCVDVTAADYHRARRIRFELVVNLLSHQHNARLRILCPVPADDTTVPSLVPIHPGTNFFEREVYDMFGITFEGHPDLTRILMPDDWVGHPLRKDFETGSVPVQFKESHQVI